MSFRVLDDGRKFKRWDHVEFGWRRPTEDTRIESRHVNSQSLRIIGQLKAAERENFLERRIVTSLNRELGEGRSLALLKPNIREFRVDRRSEDEIAQHQAKIDAFHAQDDMFIPRPAVPVVACPYAFRYVYRTDDGDRTGTCQDWETEATFFNWRNRYGEQEAIERMRTMFGETLPQRGLYFAMGTHSRYPDVWLINGLIQLRTSGQASLF